MLERTTAAMTDNEKVLAERIRELEGSAQKARLEAMQVAAALLTRESARLAGARSNTDQTGDIAALQARYDMLVRLADDAQAQLDKLHVEQHDVKYYR
jgi:hypothetical protein